MTEKQYPELPTHFMLVQESFRDEVYLYTADQMRAYADADRAMRATKAAPQPAENTLAQLDAMRSELATDIREVFDANGPETPQIVRDVIEYADSWLQAYIQMGRKKMKVFVWEDVLTDYTSGMMVAVAPTVEEARAALLKECYYIPEGDLNQQPKELDLSEAVGFVCWGGG